MKLELVKYTCANCANSFEAPALSENSYGEFLLWSKKGNVAYLNAFEDLTFKEVDILLTKHPKTSNLQAVERAKVLRHIYGGLACDAAESNSQFEIDVSPPCPLCSSQKMATWEFKNPPEIVEVAVPTVTHRHWSILTAPERLILLDARLAEAMEVTSQGTIDS